MKSWVIPKAGPGFVCGMEAVLGVYERPYDTRFPVVNLDESPRQLISQVRKPFTDSNGATYQHYEYSREGVADICMIVEALGGRREVLVEEDRTSRTYARVVAHIVEEMYPAAEKITLVEDNLSAHRPAALYPPERARSIAEKLEAVRTPRHGSWLNIAECELSVLTRQGLDKRVPDRQTLQEQVKAWYSRRNQKQTRVNWQFTTKDARVKLKKLYPAIIT